LNVYSAEEHKAVGCQTPKGTALTNAKGRENKLCHLSTSDFHSLFANLYLDLETNSKTLRELETTEE
jgi:hypothetical protein